MKFKLSLLSLLFGAAASQAQVSKMPAYPLITHDPYFSVWSFNDTLSAATTTHWTGADQALAGYVKVDGQVYRFLGKEAKSYKSILPAGDESYTAQYTEEAPKSDSWKTADFKADGWKTGPGSFGSNKAISPTLWTGRNLWTRRVFGYNGTPDQKLILKTAYDDDIEVYLNGEVIYDVKGVSTKYKYIPIPASVIGKLKKEGNVLAVHVLNTRGGALLDAGIVEEEKPKSAPEKLAVQKKIDVTATGTNYWFACGKVDVKVSFVSPLLIEDLKIMTRPVSYITYGFKTNDGAAHQVELGLSASATMATNTPYEQVKAETSKVGTLNIAKAGTVAQEILKVKGDDVRINWGYMYVAVPSRFMPTQFVTDKSVTNPFTAAAKAATMTGKQINLQTIIPVGKVSVTNKEVFTMIGYDDVESVQYFGQNLAPWWKAVGKSTIMKELNDAALEHDMILKKCDTFDKSLYQKALAAGGDEYAKLCVMAYRQSIAAHKVVQSPQGEILFLSKENFSNGSINTVDVTYPSAPMYLYYNPELLKGMLNGIFYYSESGKFAKPFAAHDLGTYPLANGQTYGEDMPVEESGNMIVLTGAIAKAEGNANYAKKHWKVLTTWAEYLAKDGFDPANQLCTDDFAGHLARNSNLSIKAIMGLRSYAMLAGMLGDKATETKYTEMSKAMAVKWAEMAKAGDHYALTFDQKGNTDSWSQKYNMVWDKLLGFNIFAPDVHRDEIKFYLTKQNEFGLPLDSRKTYTKSDWIMWTATMADSIEDFKALVHPIYVFAENTPSRVPLNDWHQTTTGKMVGFQARSVVGGYFIKMLEEKYNVK